MLIYNLLSYWSVRLLLYYALGAVLLYRRRPRYFARGGLIVALVGALAWPILLLIIVGIDRNQGESLATQHTPKEEKS